MRLSHGIPAILSVMVVCAIANPAYAGPEWKLGEDSNMKLSFLGQIHYSYMDDAADPADFYMRRGRIILSGQITDGAQFFMETDNDNAGKTGANSSTDIQDAFLDVRLFGGQWVKAGLILLPFSFETRASAASLLGIDYNAEAVKLANTFVWRDYGVELHGGLGDRFAYAVGAFDGYDTGIKNPDSGMRVTGHMMFNVIGKAETGWFYAQNPMNRTSYLSVGFGADYQGDATLDTAVSNAVPRDAEAWVADVKLGCPLGGNMTLTANGAYHKWDSAVFEGSTSFLETGLLVDKTMLTVKYSQADPDTGARTGDYTAGLHYFLKGHNLRAGVEYRWGDSDDWALAGLQFLL